MTLREVSVGRGRADGDGMVGYVVLPTVIDGRDGVSGVTGRDRAWYQASTKEGYDLVESRFCPN